MWQCKWRHLVAKLVTNASSATWWLNLQSMQLAPPGGARSTNCWLKIFTTNYVEISNAQLHIAQLRYLKSNKYHTEIQEIQNVSMRNQLHIWFDKYKQFESTFYSDFSWWKMKTMKKVCQWCQLMLMLMLLKVEEARRKLQDVPSYSLSSLDRCKSSSNARWLSSILLISNPACFSIGS